MTKEEIIVQEVLNGAKQLMQQYGLKKTTMEDIAKSVGKSKSTLYYYFKDKEEIFDKESSLSTLGYNTGSSQASYSMWNNLVYKGKSSVVNGDFTFEFIVPQDISFDYGNSRFSFYAERDEFAFCRS